MKHELIACIVIPTFAVLYSYLAKVGIKMHALSSCFISAACFITFYRAGRSGPVALVLARHFFFGFKSVCILTFCAACTLSVMYNICFMLIVKMCQKWHIWASNFQKFTWGGHAP